MINPSFFCSQVDLILSAPSPVLPWKNIMFSSPSHSQPLKISRPFVSIQSVVPATHNPTFLRVVLAIRSDVVMLSIRLSPGSLHVARGTRRGEGKWHCVAPHRLWVWLLVDIKSAYNILCVLALGLFRFLHSSFVMFVVLSVSTYFLEKLWDLMMDKYYVA